MVISIHIPKCAGTSFRLILDGLCGVHVWYNYGTIFSRDHARPELVPPAARFIHGHFLADAFDDILPERRLLTWVRHPVERVVSNYHHFLRDPDMRDDCCRLLHERNLSLIEFAELDWMQNEANRYLAGKPVEDFEFIGIAERFGESVGLFCRAFGFRDVHRMPRVNLNPDRTTERYPISRDEYEHILARNRADLEWYTRAAERLSQSTGSTRSRVA